MEKVCFSENERVNVIKEYIERTMNDENGWVIMWKEMQ